MKSTLIKLFSVASVLLLVPTSMAATVEMTWTEPEKYRDIRSGDQGRKQFEQRVFKNLTEHFEKLASTLPQDHVLKIEVTDIDLAGDVNVGGIRQIRVVKDLYFPRMKFNYDLVDANGQSVSRDSVNIKDMAFLHSMRSRYDSKPFGYEKKMLAEWFEDTLEQYGKNDI